MSLVAVYDALKEAKISDHKATAAIEALEASRDEQRLRNIEERIGNLQTEMVETRGRVTLLAWMVGVSIALALANLTMTGAILLRLAS